MKNNKTLIIILFLASLVFCGWLFNGDLREGRYFSHQYDVDAYWVNTDNLKELGAQVTGTNEGLKYTFPKGATDRVHLKVLYGAPYDGMEDLYQGLTGIEVKSRRIDRLPIGYKTFNFSQLLKGDDKFDLILRKGEICSPATAIRRIEISLLPNRGFIFDYLKYFFFLLILMTIGFYRKLGKARLSIILFTLILLLAMTLRYQEMERVALGPTHPDARHVSGISYADKAEKMDLFSKNGFYAAGYIHEPLHSFIIKIFFAVFNNQDLVLRYVSFFFSIIALFLTYLVARVFFRERIIALVSMFLIAINRFLIGQSVIGLRLELEMCFLLLLFYVAYIKREELNQYLWVVLSGVISGYWLLTKFYNLPFIVFIISYSAWMSKGRRVVNKLVVIALALVIALGIYAPYKINVLNAQRETGETDSSHYVLHFANYEFAGQEGFPRDKVTIGEYFFKLHTPMQFIGYHLIGAGGVLYFLIQETFNMIQQENHLTKYFLEGRFALFMSYPFLLIKIIFLNILALWAFLVCLKHKEKRIIFYTIILANFPNLFLYGANVVKRTAVLQTQRTIAHVLPFVAFSIGYLIYERINRSRTL